MNIHEAVVAANRSICLATVIAMRRLYRRHQAAGGRAETERALNSAHDDENTFDFLTDS